MLDRFSRYSSVSNSILAMLSIFTTAVGESLQAQPIVINEIHYDAPDNTSHEEFIELHNPGGSAVDLSGWFFSAGIDYTFPQGASCAPEGYVVIAEDPARFAARFGRSADLGPYSGRLSSDGERVTLRSRAGVLVDEVDYSVAFPWPTASAGDGSSMELIHPDLDNDLGGSWRASGNVVTEPRPPVQLLAPQSTAWRYRKGTSEPSSPASAWRGLSFVEDGTWQTGQTSIGYGDDDDNTVLADMQGAYSSCYFRHRFTVEDPSEIAGVLRLGMYVDDGAVCWINGVEVARLHVPDGDLAFEDLAESHEAAWEEVDIRSPQSFLMAGENILAIHALNQSLGSSDFSLDASLLFPGTEAGVFGDPTPGERNSVFSTSAPPQIRQVQHGPQQPPSGQRFVVTAKITDPDGVASVTLSYQVVAPGSYIPAYLPLSHGVLLADPYRAPSRNPEFDDPASWTEISMRDDGAGYDALAGDGIYSASVPPQVNRTLLRYRIRAVDAEGESVTVPYTDDPSLNFACFVYDGVPGYETTRRTIRPEGVGYVHPPEVMSSLPVYCLITRNRDIVEAIAADSSLQIPQGTQARFVENWEGAFVYEGRVHDHITYRLRGANGRYQIPPTNPSSVAGKRHWRFKFNKGNYLRARDRFGILLPARWRVLNTGRMFGNRLDGNWGLNDQVNDVIWSAYGVPAAFGHAFHWRVIDGPDESPSGADGQYEGDFWGIARAFENYDVRFLEAHGLEKGNLYKLVNQTTNGLEQLRYQAPYAVSDGSDHNNIEGYLSSSRPEAWLDAYVDYHEWYHYHALAQAFRHYDYWPSANKNAAWYFEPAYLPENSHYGRMMTFPFDADATWGPTWNDGWDRPYEAIFGGSGKVSFQKEYRNHIREVRDLLWQSDQLILVIRQTASFMDGLEEPDIDRWKDAPASEGRQYFSATSQSTLEGKIADMMQFAFTGGSWPGGSVGAGGRAQFLDSFADAPHAGDLPARPTLQYTGPAGYPVDALTFECSLFSDPQGSGTFEAMEWRLAEVTAISGAATRLLSDPIWRAEPVRLEITPTWTSGEIETFDRSITIPPWAAAVGRKHRVRVRVKDNTGLWSHWSSRLEFTAGEPAGSIDVVDSLRVTEIMYNARDGDDFDFIELYNSGSRELDLGAVSFTDGIEFCFAGSAVTSLLPGDYAVVVRDRKTFSTRYETEHISIAGEYSGQLANGGELVELTYGGISILQLEYDDGWYPETDGLGYSLEITDPAIPVSQLGDSAAWLPSEIFHGTPGLPSSGVVPVGGRQVPGDANQDVELDLSDAIALLLHLFHSPRIALPCEGASVNEGGNRTLLDSNGDATVDIADAIYLLNYIFLEGPAPALGTGCVRIEGCPNLCGQ